METFVDIISDIGAQISKIKRCRINQQTLINRLIFGSMKLPKDQGEKGTSGDKRFFQKSVLDAIYFIKEKWLWCTRTRAALSTV